MPNCAVPLAVERNCVVREIDPGYATLCETKTPSAAAAETAQRMGAGRVEDILKAKHADGKRVELVAFLAKTRIPIQVDIGFGDAITPLPRDTNFPTLLNDMIAPVVRAYPKETVVAEKLEAMVQLGLDNSRMKDFYDLWVLATQFEFDGQVLAAAIIATFERRATKIPDGEPFALTPAFSENADKIKQWSAFMRRGTSVLICSTTSCSTVPCSCRSMSLARRCRRWNVCSFRAP